MIPITPRSAPVFAAASMWLLWLSQPPVGCWPLAFVALVPLIAIATIAEPLGRKSWWLIAVVSTLYYLFSLQGLRHAHPAMYACWFALSAYLAAYHVAFVALTRRMLRTQMPLWIVAPMVWVTMELIRNYMITGISVLMLGHTMANVPWMIQIADLLGSYGVGIVIVGVNVAVLSLLIKDGAAPRRGALVAATMLLAATIGYAAFRQTAIDNHSRADKLATFALLQRNEAVEYGMPIAREVEMFQNYAGEAVKAVENASKTVDAVVWPESMFTGTVPWMIAEDDLVVPTVDDGSGKRVAMMGESDFRANVLDRQRYVEDRAGYIGRMIAAKSPEQSTPHFIGGTGVLRYGEKTSVYSGVIHLDENSRVIDWYGKTHLVMFGEYIPVLPWVPVLKNLVPSELGLTNGDSAKRMTIGDTIVSPNICIETAVERVTVGQMRSPETGEQDVDVIVTVTNDGWFDDSSVVDHHLRCAQLVAVGCRRPVLSAANNGPTAWIDHHGQIVERLGTGTNGSIIATPQDCNVKSLHVTWGDWPIRLIALITLVMAWIKRRGGTSPAEPELAEST